ncbi:HAD hydrolase-like protein [Patescibacteria group bacterium]|nr:HAD hydrolase-like protein [Patescibacteria group bacterium]MBU1931567.1 HAD hydrolase-like protein [Patescibacteria group bacterium]
MSSINRNLLTISQAVKILNIHPDTLRRWEKMGKIKSIRVLSRGHRRYRNSDILKIIQEKTQEETVPSPTLNKIHQRLKTKSKEDTLTVIKKAKCVFFDAGYTLMALFPSREDIYTQIAFEYGFHLNASEIRLHFERMRGEYQEVIKKKRKFKLSNNEMEKIWTERNTEVLRRSGIPKQEARVIGNKIFCQIWGNPRLWRKYSFTDEFLTNLKAQGKILGIIDNWDQRLLGILKKLGLKKYFRFIILGGKVGIWKPDQRLFELALKKTKIAAEHTVYIGNNYITDYLGAGRAKITPILFDNQREFKVKQRISKFYTYQSLVEP